MPFRPLHALALALLACLPGPAGAEDEVSRGAYLARVTGCEGCHSAHDAAGNILPGHLMAGGDHPIRASGGASLVPPNITPDRETGIGGWDAVAIMAAIRTGKTPDGRTLSIAMPWRTQYADLTDADARAIAVYLLTVPPVHGTGSANESSR
jgi:cytochrome c553